MRAELNALAAERQTDVGKLVRRLIADELAGKPVAVAEAIDQILYLAIAMDGLLATNPNPDLRDEHAAAVAGPPRRGGSFRCGISSSTSPAAAS